MKINLLADRPPCLHGSGRMPCKNHYVGRCAFANNSFLLLWSHLRYSLLFAYSRNLMCSRVFSSCFYLRILLFEYDKTIDKSAMTTFNGVPIVRALPWNRTKMIWRSPLPLRAPCATSIKYGHVQVHWPMAISMMVPPIIHSVKFIHEIEINEDKMDYLDLRWTSCWIIEWLHFGVRIAVAHMPCIATTEPK